MIKEFMLASALTLSNTNLFYNLDNNSTNFRRDISGTYINENQVTNLVIDLNTGFSYLADLNGDGSGTLREWKISNKMYEYSIFGELNISSYINYLYSIMGMGADTLYTYSYLEAIFDFTIIGIDFEDREHNHEVYVDTFFAIPSNENENVLLQVCDTASFDLNESSSNESNTIGYENFAFDSLNQNLFLIFTINNLYINTYEYDNVSFEFDFLYADLSMEFEIPIIGHVYSWDYDYATYSNFIYHNFHSIINENQNLERDNEILNGIIRDLRQENDELNSKHVLSNVFEIVRGAFDGVINFLEIELMPNLTIGTIIFIPVVIGVIFFILKALVL